jgi:hypothetical protein
MMTEDDVKDRRQKKTRTPTETTTMMFPTRVVASNLFSLLLLAPTVGAFTPYCHRDHRPPYTSPLVVCGAVTTTTTTSLSSDETTLTGSLKDLLEGLKGEDGGQRLLAASSGSWRTAIYQALAAPVSANEEQVATSLTSTMRKPDNQFAILMGAAEPFVATFPSDPVINAEDNTAWVECRLRQADATDKLLVTMGISLVRSGGGEEKKTNNNQWLIAALDWQDFRDAFYPGLSGREWLRAF